MLLDSPSLTPAEWQARNDERVRLVERDILARIARDYGGDRTCRQVLDESAPRPQYTLRTWVCSEDGRWANCAAASNALGVTKHAVRNAVRRGGHAGGGSGRWRGGVRVWKEWEVQAPGRDAESRRIPPNRVLCADSGLRVELPGRGCRGWQDAALAALGRRSPVCLMRAIREGGVVKGWGRIWLEYHFSTETV